jgi:hypothetical protein
LWLGGLAALGFLAAALVLLWGVNMRRGLNHDEHQFVTSAALIAREGLLPYRDFPYFHVPGLSFLYAAFYGATPYLLLSARTVSILSSWLTLALIFGAALAWLRPLGAAWRLGAGASTVLLLMATPSFLHAAGRAWNHDLPIFLTLAAAVGQVAWLKRAGGPNGSRRWATWWPLAAGVLLGLAAATRATFVLAAAAFALSIFLVSPWRVVRSWAAVGLLALGGLVGAAPALAMLAVAPVQFVFGNLTYASLNTAYYAAAAAGEASSAAMTMGGKVVRSAEYVLTQPGNLLFVLLSAGAVWGARRALPRARELLFLLLLVPFFLLGAYAPTPLQEQYIYLIFPLLALIFLAALPYASRPRLGIGFAAAAALVAAVLAVPRYVEGLAVAFTPAEWFPLKVHARGEYMANLTGPSAAARPVLTLAPIYPLEGHAPIYPEFVTGPLAWRVAPLLAAEERARFGIVGLDELPADLAARPPRGILTAVDNSDAAEEAPLVAYAQAHGYVPIPLPDEGTFWAAPIATWADAIRLGAADLPRAPILPGHEFVATLHLQAAAPITANLNVLARLVAPDGSELLRSEGWPWGRATSTWPAGEVWPDGHTFVIPPAAAPGPYRVEVSFYDPATLALLGDPLTVGHIVVSAPTPVPASPLAHFGPGIELLAAGMPPTPWSPGATQTVTLTWRAAAPVPGRYTVFLHLLGPTGAPVAQGDREPWAGAYPTDAWLPGAPAADTYTLALPPDLPPGDYQLVVGLYDPLTGARLPLLTDGQPGGDSFALGPITVP